MIPDIDRDFGPTEPVMAPGDLEYRYDLPEPLWDESKRTTTDLGKLLLEVAEMGRKRNPKKELLREVMRDWDEADAYVALRAIPGPRFPHPEVNISVDTNAVYEALGRVFLSADDPEGAAKKWVGDDTIVEALRSAQPEHPPDGHDPEPVPLNEFWGKWMYELAEEGGSNRQADLMEAMFRRLDVPWVLAEAVLCNLTLYCGDYMVLKSLNSEYELEERGLDHWRAWRATTGDIPSFYLEIIRGEATEELRPHAYHNTMKANSTDAAEVADELDHDKWLAQTKYDGARLFVHHDGDGDIRAYTGGGNDVTSALPELEDIDWPDNSFMFDAEATPYDEDGNVIPFENIMTRLTRKGDIDPDDFDTTVVFKFFDCMYWRGRDITKQKYTDRFTIVKSVFDPDNIARTGEDLETTFHASLEAGHEGLVLKKKDGQYMPGGRHGQWLKWKPEPETLDVEVIGVQKGGGRLSDRMGALKVGLEGPDGEVLSVGKVGTGFSDSERKEWWVDYETGDALGQVIEVEYEEFQPNDDGWGLRFPSFQRKRPDGVTDTIERAAKLQDRHEQYEEWLAGKL